MVLLHYSQIMVFVIIEVSNKQAVFLVIPLIEKFLKNLKFAVSLKSTLLILLLIYSYFCL